MIQTKVYFNDKFSINAVYKFTNFLDIEYLNILLKKTEELTIEDKMNKKTNVKANMTFYNELLNHKEYEVFCRKVLQIIDFIMRLRLSYTDYMRYEFVDLWGMRHKKGDYSQIHCHYPTPFCGAFYLKVPHSTKINFPEFNLTDILEDNSLYLFTGTTNHSVDYQEYEENRISLAFNIGINVFKK